MGSSTSKESTNEKAKSSYNPVYQSKTLVPKQSYSITPRFTSYDALSTNRFTRAALLPKPTLTQVAPPLPLAPPPKSKINVDDIHGLWTDLYYKNRIDPHELKNLNSRIETNADLMQKKNEQLAHNAYLERLNANCKSYQETVSTKPPMTLNSFVYVRNRIDSIKDYEKKYFTPEKKPPVLTPEMLAEIQQASRPHPQDQMLAELDGVQILRKDIQTLLGMNWLNDEIVNAYMNLLVLRGGKDGYKKVYSFNTFFYPKLRESGYNSIRRWTRKVDIFSYDYILVPVHLGNHWCLAFIDLTNRVISYYDSLGGHPNGCCDTLLDYLRYESNDKKKQDFDDENWRLVDSYSEGIPQQKNCSDCGVFACIYAEYLTRQAKLNFGQEQMPYFRKKMIYEIITKKILD